MRHPANRLEHVFHAIVDACTPLDAQTVVALGNNGLSPALFSDAASNIRVTTYAPQRDLLQRASACITHAGLNTTLDCLEAGVPMLAIPLASEQPGIAMRVAHLGAGRVLPLSELTGERLHTELLHLLKDDACRGAASRAAQQLAGANAAAQAVDLLEQCLRTL